MSLKCDGYGRVIAVCPYLEGVFFALRDILIHVTTICLRTLALLVLSAVSALAQKAADRKDWVDLFNGKNLDNWVVKIAGHELGDNYGDTFRAENGMIRVSYDKYTEFGARFSHLFYKQRLSHYRLEMEYRFVGEQMKGGPSYARLNSGVMIHSQVPETILKDQDWPISVEAQFLGNTDKDNRTTMNVCTPGTDIFMNGQMVKPHCVNSKSKIYKGDGWVKIEVEVMGAERVRHIIDGETVLQYEQPQIGGGVANRYDPAIKVDGTILTAGYIGLQSESHPVDFRNIKLLNLSGCMDPKALNYKTYFVNTDNTQCTYKKKK